MVFSRDPAVPGPAASVQASWRSIVVPPWAVAAALIALCAAAGLRMVSGLALPPDVDSLRDLGFAQGMLDGNLFGDPSYAGESRFYPPLIVALRTLLFRLGGGDDLPRHWVLLAPWLNLLVPLGFFLMARRLLGSPGAAATALAVFVFLNGAVSRAFITGGYTPWPWVPTLAQALFFLAVWLIHVRVEAARWRDAILIGFTIGATGLAHLVPAVLLTGIVTLTAFVAQGLRLRTIGWLAVVAAAQLAVMAPYLLPVLLNYPDGTLHGSYEWVDDILKPWPASVAKLALLNLPGLAAAALLLGPLRHRVPPLGRVTTAILVAWIGIAAGFLLRHYACSLLPADGLADAPGACRVFVVAVHHYHFYLQTAWPLLIGFAGYHLVRRWLAAAPPAAQPRRRALAAALLLLLSMAGAARLLHRPIDLMARDMALDEARTWTMDLDAYRWMLAETGPDALFVTRITSTIFGPDVYAVMAAGRKLVSMPEYFSHPYVDWAAREALRTRYLAGFEGSAEAIPCAVAARGLWALLPRDAPVAPDRAVPVFRGALHTAWRALPPTGCDRPPG